jgi:hypothetical protein
MGETCSTNGRDDKFIQNVTLISEIKRLPSKEISCLYKQGNIKFALKDKRGEDVEWV